MRVLMTVELDVEKTNNAVKCGTLSETINSIVEEQKPESAYFTTFNGKRSGHLVLDLENVSQLPAFTEPWFLAFNANVDIKPVMTPADLAEAASSIEKIVKTYSK